ncbi:MAG: AraC family transcriptional regulator [Treponema sp.]|jgi:AraC-like DNA-binding protein|nr:AraC family transcriptional regulator [Treponema sp.]
MNQPFYEKEPLKPIERTFPFLVWDSPRVPFWFPQHWHERMEMLYVLKGSFNADINGKAWAGHQGDIVAIDTGLIHGFFDSSADSAVRIFQFGPDIFNEALVELQNRELTMPVFGQRPLISASADKSLHDGLERLLMEIDAEYKRQEAGFRLLIKAKLYEIAALLLRNTPPPQQGSRIHYNKKNNTQLLERIFSCLYDNHDDPSFMLEDAAREVGLSKFYLTRFLKEQTGQGFHEHLTRIRLRAAENRLASSDMPITDIAFLCGFQSLASFNRAFRCYIGVNPSVYQARKQLSHGSPLRNAP